MGNSQACGVDAEKDWLRGYMADWYLWAGSAPDPSPAGFATVNDYFEALLFTGAGGVPADRWSYIYDTAEFAGLLSTGTSWDMASSSTIKSRATPVAHDSRLEVQLPLNVRFTEAESPAVSAGLKRGDTIVSINGKTSAAIVATNDFAALVPAKAGDRLKIAVDNGAGPITYDLVARTYAVTPVPIAITLSSPHGIKGVYLVLNTFIPQAEPPEARFAGRVRLESAREWRLRYV